MPGRTNLDALEGACVQRVDMVHVWPDGVQMSENLLLVRHARLGHDQDDQGRNHCSAAKCGPKQ
eukprot:1019514-Prorocentrum_minimum.AAC.1